MGGSGPAGWLFLAVVAAGLAPLAAADHSMDQNGHEPYVHLHLGLREPVDTFDLAFASAANVSIASKGAGGGFGYEVTLSGPTLRSFEATVRIPLGTIPSEAIAAHAGVAALQVAHPVDDWLQLLPDGRATSRVEMRFTGTDEWSPAVDLEHVGAQDELATTRQDPAQVTDLEILFRYTPPHTGTATGQAGSGADPPDAPAQELIRLTNLQVWWLDVPVQMQDEGVRNLDTRDRERTALKQWRLSIPGWVHDTPVDTSVAAGIWSKTSDPLVAVQGHDGDSYPQLAVDSSMPKYEIRYLSYTTPLDAIWFGWSGPPDHPDYILQFYHQTISPVPPPITALIPVAILALAIPGATYYGAWRHLNRPGLELAHPPRYLTSALAVGLTLYGLILLIVLAEFDFVKLMATPYETVGIVAYVLLAICVAIGLVVTLRHRVLESRAVAAARVASDEAAQQSTRRAEELQGALMGASHDLKAPLTALNWLAADLKDELAHVESTEARAAVDRISNSIGGMQRLVTELLEIGQLEEGVKTTRMDVAGVVEEARDRVEELRRALGGTIDTTIQDLRIRAERKASVQAITNLLTNGLRYGRQGSSQIRLSTETTATEVHLHVDDNGPGIPDEHREQVFGLFQRNPAETRDIEGTGLGLALVKRAMEAQGGRVTIDKAPGLHGARFTLTWQRV